MTLVMQLRHGLATADGGKGEIEVALLQRSRTPCLTPLEESAHSLNLTIFGLHEYYTMCDIIVKREVVLRGGVGGQNSGFPTHKGRRTERMKVG